jgi:hypothetical protein
VQRKPDLIEIRRMRESNRKKRRHRTTPTLMMHVLFEIPFLEELVAEGNTAMKIEAEIITPHLHGACATKATESICCLSRPHRAAHNQQSRTSHVSATRKISYRKTSE